MKPPSPIPRLLAALAVLANIATTTSIPDHHLKLTADTKTSQIPLTSLSDLDISQDRGTLMRLPPAASIPTPRDTQICRYDHDQVPLRTDAQELSRALKAGDEEVTKSDSVGQCYVAFTHGSARVSLCIESSVRRKKIIRSNGWMKAQLAEYLDGLLGGCRDAESAQGKEGKRGESGAMGGTVMFQDMEGFFFKLDRR